MSESTKKCFVLYHEGRLIAITFDKRYAESFARQQFRFLENCHIQPIPMNANLIAVAPELLEACEKLLLVLNTLENFRDPNCEEFARKAIAKAKGEKEFVPSSIVITSPDYFEDDQECGYCERKIGEKHKANCRQ